MARIDLIADVASLKPYPHNSRTHSSDQIGQIMASIREFGFTKPILVDEDFMILAGHGGVRAAQELGMETVPAVQITGLTSRQKKALVIADNKIALNAGWDSKMLALELKDLSAMDFNLDLTGFNAVEIAHITGLTSAQEGEDDEIAPPAEPVSKLGDLWLMGDHRVKCGDSTDAATVADLLRDDVPNLMVTDPPYGVEYDANWRNEADHANGKPYGGRAIGKVENDARADWSEAWALFPGNVAYVWHSALHSSEVENSLVACAFDMRAQVIWNKNNAAISRGHYHWKHEPCWYAVRKGENGNWQGGRKQNTVWDIDKPQKSETGHSTQKPVECMRRPIENNSKPGEFVYDPFLGSGATVIAGETVGRKILGLELNPAYIDVIVLRWQKFTGGEAVHAVTGERFNVEVKVAIA